MKKKNNKNLIAAITCVAIILIIIALSGSNIGWKVEKQAVSSVKLKSVAVTKVEGEPYGAGPGTPIYTISVTNTFIPRQYELPYHQACLYNTELKTALYADTKWDVKGEASQLGQETTSLEIIKGTKTANLLVFQGIRYTPKDVNAIPAAATPTKVQEEVYDQLLLYLQEGGLNPMFPDCSNLQESDINAAIKIPIIK